MKSQRLMKICQRASGGFFLYSVSILIKTSCVYDSELLSDINSKKRRFTVKALQRGPSLVRLHRHIKEQND